MNKRLALVLVSCVLGASAALAQQAPPPYTAAIVMEPETKTVLLDENAHTMVPIASMTKMMTLMLVLDEIEAGRLEWTTPVTVSAKASKMGGSQVYLAHNETFPVEDLVAATMVHSANDAAMALAEKIGGSSDHFVQMMNDKAAAMGLKETRFYSPHGLPDPGQQDDMMSPYDLAILGSELMKSERMRKLAVTKEMPFRDGKFIMYNPNHLLRDYPEATGIKTGFHNKAGFCVTASARRGDLDLVAVVTGSKNKKDNFGSAASLFNDAFRKWEKRTLVTKGKNMPTNVPVREGIHESVGVVAGDAVNVLSERGGKSGYRVSVSGDTPTAPVKQGQQVGWIIVKKDGQPVAKVPALAANDIERAGWFARTWDKVWPF